MGREGPPVLIFDGNCGFCTWSAHWVARGWRGRARAVPWQALGPEGLAELGLTVDEAGDAAWWVDQSGARSRGHKAIGRSLIASHGCRRLAGALVLFSPLTWLAAGVYRLVARHRSHLPGTTPACRPEDPRST